VEQDGPPRPDQYVIGGITWPRGHAFRVDVVPGPCAPSVDDDVVRVDEDTFRVLRSSAMRLLRLEPHESARPAAPAPAKRPSKAKAKAARPWWAEPMVSRRRSRSAR
jgi:hypothetical protein